MKKLFLLPTPIGTEDQIFDFNISQIKDVKSFIVEKAKTARQFLSSKSVNVHEKVFIELDKNQKYIVTEEIIGAFNSNEDICLMSEAGCPAIADPGNEVVMYAHQSKYQVIPLVGPSSIILALIASGLNGQHFEFIGYLPIDRDMREKALLKYERESFENNKTIIFIEAPYRSKGLFLSMLKILDNKTLLSVANELQTAKEVVKTMTIYDWNKQDVISIEFNRTIFLIYKRRL